MRQVRKLRLLKIEKSHMNLLKIPIFVALCGRNLWYLGKDFLPKILPKKASRISTLLSWLYSAKFNFIIKKQIITVICSMCDERGSIFSLITIGNTHSMKKYSACIIIKFQENKKEKLKEGTLLSKLLCTPVLHDLPVGNLRNIGQCCLHRYLIQFVIDLLLFGN